MARVLAMHGATVVLACRDIDKAESAAERSRLWDLSEQLAGVTYRIAKAKDQSIA